MWQQMRQGVTKSFTNKASLITMKRALQEDD
jgi:hypothetical protein